MTLFLLWSVLALAAAASSPAMPARTTTAARGAAATPAVNAPAPLGLVAPGSALGPLPEPGTSVTSTGVAAYWRTRAEKTGYRQTSDYDETMRYCRQIEATSNWMKVTSYGTSGQGRALPLVILSKDRAFTPEAARRTGKPIVLIQNGIHAGEIEGKDACLALMRDMLVTRTRETLLDSAIVLVLPIFSVDAHERASRYNRINQNGPDPMGWRYSPIGLNLNRDYLKVETPEMRAMISKVYTAWWPHLLVDNHTTDGADYQHDLTFGVNHGPANPHPIAAWMDSAVAGRAVRRLTVMGHLPAPYLSFRANSDPLSGISEGDAPPRFSTGYAPLQGRAAVLTETHMLKPYDNRVKATYDWMVALLEEVNAHPKALLDAVAASEAEIIARGQAIDPSGRTVVLTAAATDSSERFRFRGFVTRWEMSDITGAPVAHYTSIPSDTSIRIFRSAAPLLVIRQPLGYLVPQEWTTVRDRLDIHGIRYRTLTRAWSDTVELQRVVAWSASDPVNEGHHPVTESSVINERHLRTFRAGDLWVPLDQRSGLLAVHLLDAEAPEGLLYWNAFDAALAPKEYAEGYVMEPIARDMMAKDPALAAQFRRRVASDSAFAKDPDARIDFFYRRSPWADPEQNLSPVARALRRPPESVLSR